MDFKRTFYVVELETLDGTKIHDRLFFTKGDAAASGQSEVSAGHAVGYTIHAVRKAREKKADK